MKKKYLALFLASTMIMASDKDGIVPQSQEPEEEIVINLGTLTMQDATAIAFVANNSRANRRSRLPKHVRPKNSSKK